MANRRSSCVDEGWSFSVWTRDSATNLSAREYKDSDNTAPNIILETPKTVLSFTSLTSSPARQRSNLSLASPSQESVVDSVRSSYSIASRPSNLTCYSAFKKRKRAERERAAVVAIKSAASIHQVGREHCILIPFYHKYF